MDNLFFTDEHIMIRDMVREFADSEITPVARDLDEQGKFPRDLVDKMGEMGLMGIIIPEEYGGAGLDMVAFATAIMELARADASVAITMAAHSSLGSLPILMFGSDEQKNTYLPKLASGEMLGAFGLTEPNAGSDAGATKTKAVRAGDEYVVNGGKMFITSGLRADWLTCAVRTGGLGAGGISLLLVDMASAGVERTRLDKMGWRCSDTAAIHFTDVRVPATNLIGPENGGFIGIMRNFNSERLGMAMGCCAYARVAMAEAADWARQRETFGKPLVGHQSIRIKLADMERQIEATQAWVDLCAWQVREGCDRPADFAMLKVQATRMLEAVAREAAQVLGGASYITGSKVERIYREVRVNAIGGGSEEIMLDLAGRQLFGGSR